MNLTTDDAKDNDNWDVCPEPGCTGAALTPYENCLGHLTDSQLVELMTWVAEIRQMDARGVELSAQLVGRFVQSIPRVDGKRPPLRGLFRHATFGDGTVLRGVEFDHQSSFDRATFGNEVRFSGTAFGDKVSFRSATFGDDARFLGCRFGEGASFKGATFGKGTRFDGGAFGPGASFEDVTFGDDAWL